MANKPLHSTGNKPIHSTVNKPIYGDVIFWTILEVQMFTNYAVPAGGACVAEPDDMGGTMDSPSPFRSLMFFGNTTESITGYERSRVGTMILDWNEEFMHGGWAWESTTQKWKVLLYGWRFGYSDFNGGHTFNVDAGIYVRARVRNAAQTMSLATDYKITVLQDILLDDAGENNDPYSGSPVATVRWDPVEAALTVS